MLFLKIIFLNILPNTLILKKNFFLFSILKTSFGLDKLHASWTSWAAPTVPAPETVIKTLD